MSFYKIINKKQLGGIFLQHKKIQKRKIQISIKRRKFERKQEPLKLYRPEVTSWT